MFNGFWQKFGAFKFKKVIKIAIEIPAKFKSFEFNFKKLSLAKF